MAKEPQTYRKWKEEEVEYLLLKYSVEPTKNVARFLKRPIASVAYKALSLKLKKSEPFQIGASARKRHRNNPKLISWKTKFLNYKVEAKRRGKCFSLNLEEFIALSSQKCHYCGANPIVFNAFKADPRKISKWIEPHLIEPANILWNGLDRIDSSIGYEVSNCLPCCGFCNRSKLDKTYQEFMEWIERLIAFRSSL